MDTTPTSVRNAVAFIWSGQDGIFELAYTPKKRTHFTRHEALSVLDENRYFAPLARKTRGSKKSDVAETGNVLWADIDDLKGLEDRLQRLLPLVPSLVVFSGRKGYWVYLKLAVPVLTDEIELLNKGLETLLGADSCHNRDRLARLPGSIHQDSGKLAQVVEFSGVVYSYEDVVFLKDHVPSKANRSAEPVADGTTPSLISFPTEFPALSGELRLYIERSPRRGESGYDRSEMEQKIFTALTYQGWTDDEIISFATGWKPPRHLQEWAKRKNYSWTERSIRKAREWVAEHSRTNPDSSTTSGMCIGSDSKESYSHTDRHKALRLVTGAQTTHQLVQAWMAELPNHPPEATAYRMLKQFKNRGLISKNGRLWELTALGKHHTATKMDYLMVLPKIRDKQAS